MLWSGLSHAVSSITKSHKQVLLVPPNQTKRGVNDLRIFLPVWLEEGSNTLENENRPHLPQNISKPSITTGAFRCLFIQIGPPTTSKHKSSLANLQNPSFKITHHFIIRSPTLQISQLLQDCHLCIIIICHAFIIALDWSHSECNTNSLLL